MVGAVITQYMALSNPLLVAANTPAERCKSLNTIAEFWPVLDSQCAFVLDFPSWA